MIWEPCGAQAYTTSMHGPFGDITLTTDVAGVVVIYFAAFTGVPSALTLDSHGMAGSHRNVFPY